MSKRLLGALVGALVLVVAVVAVGLMLGRGSGSSSTSRPQPSRSRSPANPSGSAGAASEPAAPKPSGPPAVITPADAKKTVLTYIAGNNKANARLDLASELKLEGGVTAENDKGFYHVAKIMKEKIPAFQARDIVTYVPRQSSYPASFLATFHSQPHGEKVTKTLSLYVFTKASANDAWRLTDGGGVASSSTLHATLDADGYLPAYDPASTGISAESVRKAWVAASSAGWHDKSPAAMWAANSVLKKALHYTKRGHATYQVTFAPTKFVPTCFATRPAVCFVSALKRERATTVAHWYWVFSQDKRAANYALPNGRYKIYNETENITATVLVTKAAAGTRLTLADADWSVIAETAVRYTGR